MLDIWRLNTPALDFLAPDLYLQNYEMICQFYSENDNLLFIPEMRRDAVGARRLWLALATYGALGIGPFGIDTLAHIIGREYKLIAQVSSFLLAAAPEDRFGFFFDEEPLPNAKDRWTKIIGDYKVTSSRSRFNNSGPLLWQWFSSAYQVVTGHAADRFHFEAGKVPLATQTEVATALITYYIVILGGRELMRNRQKFDLNGLFKIHNFQPVD